MPKAAIFDLDGTLLDSVDLHALAWHEAMKKFGHDVNQCDLAKTEEGDDSEDQQFRRAQLGSGASRQSLPRCRAWR